MINREKEVSLIKNYKRVIKERYDRQYYDGKGITGDIYSPINPIGFYGEYKAAQILYEFVNMIRAYRRPLDKIKICDCGCGGGIKTRILAELLGNPNQVYGVEYSKNRLQHCRDMNTYVHYEYGDITKEGGIPFDVQFDGITAFVVFMHFALEKEIMSALKNIYNSLKKKGFFLWYELSSDSHWEGTKKNVDHWGFSAKEMDKYASKAGFKLVKQHAVYAKLPLIDKSTIYLAKDINRIWILDVLEKLPLRKGNHIRIYRKE